jgi:hypothetical protein
MTQSFFLNIEMQIIELKLCCFRTNTLRFRDFRILGIYYLLPPPLHCQGGGLTYEEGLKILPR